METAQEFRAFTREEKIALTRLEEFLWLKLAFTLRSTIEIKSL
jgi:hypothetical protein